MKYTCTCSVRFDDLDAYGHVNNVTFAEYLREARLAFLEEVVAARFVVARQVIDYRAPVPWRTEPLAVNVWVTSIGATSVTLDGEIRDGETTFVTARTVIVALDSGQPRVLRADERQRLSTYVNETEEKVS